MSEPKYVGRDWGPVSWFAWRDGSITPWGFWIRVFGFGIWIGRDNGGLLFSERYGYTKVIRIFGLKIKFLSK